VTASPPAAALAGKLADAAEGMSVAERACLKILLASAAAELLQTPADVGSSGADALEALKAAAARIQPHHRALSAHPWVYRGRPEWLSDEILGGLRLESEQLRGGAIRFNDHLVVSGAPLARQIATSEHLALLLNPLVGRVVPTGKANYLYYDEPGMGIEPHLDTDEFSLNVILMLDHTSPDTKRSALVLYPTAEPPVRIYLAPGEIIAIFADSVIHAREYMGQDERVSIAAFGFTPEGGRDDR
jgi:hypothetical protein